MRRRRRALSRRLRTLYGCVLRTSSTMHMAKCTAPELSRCPSRTIE